LVGTTLLWCQETRSKIGFISDERSRFVNVHAGTVTGKAKSIRCAIYTRKSSDEGPKQEFNSLDGQYEACQAYASSQRHEGWKLVPDRFDDGSLSGGTVERPALQRLLAEIDAGRIGMVVVYKIDRLTRSLADIARLVERLDAKGCSFVSVTQAFGTSTSMGRLPLNVLLSFAEFARTRAQSTKFTTFDCGWRRRWDSNPR
jgi:site-specific DNA recombinase